MPNFFIFDENVFGKQKIQKKLNFEVILRNRQQKEVKFVKKYNINKPILCLNYKSFLKTYARGVHISLFYDNILSKIPKIGVRTVSCHNFKEILYAIRVLKADFIFISPVFETKSHPDAKPLGFMRFFKMVNGVNFDKFIPLGGVNEDKFKVLKTLDFNNKINGFAGIRFNLGETNK